MTQPDRATFVTIDGSITSIDVVHQKIAELWLEYPWIGLVDRMALETALIELVTNIIRYALREEGARAEMRLLVGDSEMRAEVTDRGHEFSGDLKHLAMPPPQAESGRGLAVIDSLVDVFEYTRRARRNRWTIVRRLSVGGAS